MDWESIWNSTKNITTKNLYEYNGYQLNSNNEFNNFINEITKDLPVKENIKILDLGCGNGSFSNILLKNKNIQNYELFGLDFCKSNIQYATENYNGTFTVHDIKNKLLFENNVFDLILCVSTLFYLENEEQLNNVLDEIKRVSKEESVIFLGNCMDFEKKELALELRKKTHTKKSEHLFIKKNTILNKFNNSYVHFINNVDLDLDFYTGSQYKFNTIITNTQPSSIGIDFHDTLTLNPTFFLNLLINWKGKRIIVTGTPLSKKIEIINQLNNLGFYKGYHYDNIEFGYEYEKEDMDYNHFSKMKEHKQTIIKKHNIKIYIDDNPYYVNVMRDLCEIVLQPILSTKYINKFKDVDKYFCCNLQEKQFDFLTDYSNKKKMYVPGVYDLFHIGHLKFIKKAKELHNSYLIIGIQSDKSVFKQKQKECILNENERKSFINELQIADNVIIYDNINQTDFLKKYKIDIFVIGEGYGSSNEHKNTLHYCKENKIEVALIERTKTISTSDLIKRCKKHQ